MSLLAPANAVAGMMPGGGLLPTPNPLATVRSKRFNVTGVYLQAWFLLNSPFILFSVASDGRNAIRRPRSSQYGADRCHGNTGTQHEPPGGRRLYSMFSACWTGMTYSFISLLIRLFLQTSWSSCSPWIQSKKRSLPLAARLYSAGVSILEDSCRLNPLAAGLNLSPGLKTDASSKEIEEAMKRVREAQSLISAAIEPGSEFSPPLSPRCFSCLSRFYHQA